ncbi:MAG TPA: tyrosine-protein phosphatase [Jatrophihabitantaceae bacterium]|nr:tyrosine-protein phosphatase [Jatrophihabitantaceae bacterium]
MDESRWIDLDGAVNVRDLGGLETDDGRIVQRDRLIRSDNLQALSEHDVRTLVDDHHVRSVADLRTGVEVASEGPGPLTREPGVVIEHYSLFPEAGHNTDVAALDDDGPVVLPWQNLPPDASGSTEAPKSASDFYLRYLLDRPDSVIDTLRLIAKTDGATVVHCAAGKDRTGVVVAIALAEVGVRRAAIIDDYAMSAERIHEIFARLRASDTYSDDLSDATVDKHAPRDTTMQHLLDAIDEVHGGVPAWLRKHGWTDEDAEALRRRLLD